MNTAHRHRRGFSLVELTLAVFVTTLVFMGLHSAILVAARATDDGTGGAALSPTLDAQRAVDMISGDLACATSVSQATASALTFVVPDRTGDRLPDTIAYLWSSSTGVLTRVVNGGGGAPARPLLVARGFRFDVDSVQVAKPLTYTTSAEVLLNGTPPRRW